MPIGPIAFSPTIRTPLAEKSSGRSVISFTLSPTVGIGGSPTSKAARNFVALSPTPPPLLLHGKKWRSKINAASARVRRTLLSAALPSILILRQPTDLATLSFRAIRSRGSDEDARRNLPSVHPCHSDRRRASATASGGTCFCSCQADTPARRLAHLLSSPRSGRRARPIGLRPIPSALQATLTAGAS